MSRIPDSFIDALLARTDIVEVIDARVKLRRAGREYTACCPFHDERSPSFTVSPTKQFYHCFGCGAHCTVIKFVMEYDRLEFVDAVEELAKRVGMDVPRDEHQKKGPQDDFAPLYAATRQAADWFRQQLGNAPTAKAYLQKRGVDAATQAKFELGYAPGGWDALLSALARDETSRRTLDKVGLSSKNDAGKVYDKFRERLMFPIHDRRGFLEEVVIRMLKDFGIISQRLDGYTGVWVNNNGIHRKIYALGVHLSRWVSMHGIALNVHSDLAYFQKIIPCGIIDDQKSVTSMAVELKNNIDLSAVKERFVFHSDKLFVAKEYDKNQMSQRISDTND